jgi:hypothetical protein
MQIQNGIYKAELLRVQGLNVMSTAEHQMATQTGVFPFLQHRSFITMTMVLYARLSLWYCMHNYYYDIVCMQNYDITPLVRFCEVLYINLCIDHAKIFINLPPENHKNMFSFSAFHVSLPPKPTGNWSLPSRFTDRNRLNWRFNLDFEFVRFWSVTAAYRPVYRNRWPAVRWTGSVR